MNPNPRQVIGLVVVILGIVALIFPAWPALALAVIFLGISFFIP